MGRRSKQHKEELIATNSEEYLAKQWDAQFETVRGRIERVLKTGRDPHRDLSTLVIRRFRDAISALTHFQSNQPLLLEKCKDLLGLVADIGAYGRSNFGTAPPLLIQFLEVFIKEALVHPSLRYLLSPRKRLVEASGAPLVQELVLGHLYLSFPKQICPNFTDSFCWSLVVCDAPNDGRASELGLGLGLDSILALLNTSFSSHMPYLLQGHLAILASTCMETRNQNLDFGLGFNWAVNAFELSAKLYWRSLCDLDLGQKSRPSLRRGTNKPLLNQAPDCRMDEVRLLFRATNSKKIAQNDLLSCIYSYIDETQQTVHGNSSLRTGDALKGIVSVLFADGQLGKKRVPACKISQELVTVAASARLMASSLFRVVAEARAMIGCAQRPGRGEKDLELEGQLMSSLNLESDASCRFAGSKADRVVRKVLLDALSVESSSRKRSVLMLEHFVKLMLLGLRTRVDFIWKVCVQMLSAIMNLMAFEGEDFDALRLLAGDAHDPMEAAKDSTCKRKMKTKQLDAEMLPNASVKGEVSCQSKNDTRDRRVSPEVRADLSEDHVNFTELPDDLEDFIDTSIDDMQFWLREREGVLKKMQQAAKKRRRLLLGMHR